MVVKNEEVRILRVGEDRSEIVIGRRTRVTALGLEEFDNSRARDAIDVDRTIATWRMWIKTSIGWWRNIGRIDSDDVVFLKASGIFRWHWKVLSNG
jgi:hypothetical protein